MYPCTPHAARRAPTQDRQDRRPWHWSGLSEAAVFLQKIRAYGDPRLFALSLVADQFSRSAQPIVPERLFVTTGGEGGAGALGTTNVFTQLIALLLAEKAGVSPAGGGSGTAELEAFAAGLARRFGRPGADTGLSDSELDARVEQEIDGAEG